MIVVKMIGMRMMRKMIRTWRRCRGGNDPEFETKERNS